MKLITKYLRINSYNRKRIWFWMYPLLCHCKQALNNKALSPDNRNVFQLIPSHSRILECMPETIHRIYLNPFRVVAFKTVRLKLVRERLEKIRKGRTVLDVLGMDLHHLKATSDATICLKLFYFPRWNCKRKFCGIPSGKLDSSFCVGRVNTGHHDFDRAEAHIAFLPFG